MSSNGIPTIQEIAKMDLPELEVLLQQQLPTKTRGYVLLQMAHLYNHAGNSPQKIPELLDEVLTIGEQEQEGAMLISANGAYGWYYMKTYDNVRAFEHMQRARHLAIEHADKPREQAIAKALAALFSKLGFNSKAIELQKEVYQLESESGTLSLSTCMSLGALLANNKQFEEALLYYKEALELGADAIGKEEKLILLENLSIANLELGNYKDALSYAQQLEHWAGEYDHNFFVHRSYCLYASLHGYNQQWEDSLKYGQLANDFLGETDWTDKLVSLAETMMKAAAQLGKHEMAYNHAERLISLQRRLDNEEVKRTATKFEYQLDIEKKEKEFEVRLANTRLNTLTKIASDIAHEVQNPLQFVNNFSEFNMDLGLDLKEALATNNAEEANAAADEMIANSEKIRDYGKRIAGIVDHLLDQTRKAQLGELDLTEHNPHDFS